MSLRTDLARRAQRLLGPPDVSILSDDCWGGQYYRSLQLPYLTPTVGCWVEPAHYLDFVEHFTEDNALRLLSVHVEKDYPVLTTRHARLHFIHDHDPRKVAETFERRVARLNLENIAYGRLGATDGEIHQGVEVADWSVDAAVNFYLSRRHFDLLTWLRTGTLENRAWKQVLYTLFADPFWKETLRRKLPRRADRTVTQP